MATIPVNRASVTELDRASFAGLLGGFVALWVAAQAFILLSSKAITTELVQVALVPIVVGVLAYVYTYPTASIPELGVIAVWGIFAQRIAGFAWVWVFSAGPAGEVSISAVLMSGTAQLRLMALMRFLGMALVFAGFYAAAGYRRDQSLISAVILLSVPVTLLIIHVIV